MARRDSMLEDAMDLSARLPWQVGVGLAIVTFVVFHVLGAGALQPHTAPKDLNALGSQVTHQLLATVAYLMQFVLPPAFLIGAAVSYFRRLRGARAVSRAAVGGTEAISSTDHSDFELMVGAALRNAGYRVANQTLPGPDGGVDLVVERDRKRVLVQCKHWQTKSVGVGVIREIVGVVASRKADGAMVVTSGRFTDEAKAFAARTGVDLIDGERLQKLIGTGQSQSVEAPRKSGPADGQPAEAPAATSPACPKCGGAMVRRTARQGVYAGKDFWACRGYPSCRGIINIPT
jgi:restriction system protein